MHSVYLFDVIRYALRAYHGVVQTNRKNNSYITYNWNTLPFKVLTHCLPLWQWAGTRPVPATPPAARSFQACCASTRPAPPACPEWSPPLQHTHSQASCQTVVWLGGLSSDVETTMSAEWQWQGLLRQCWCLRVVMVFVLAIYLSCFSFSSLSLVLMFVCGGGVSTVRLPALFLCLVSFFRGVSTRHLPILLFLFLRSFFGADVCVQWWCLCYPFTYPLISFFSADICVW